MGCKTHWSAKRKTTNVISEVVIMRCSANNVSQKFYKIHRKTSLLESLSWNFIKKRHWHWCLRSSCSQLFFKIGALKKFAKLKWKHMCWSLFLKKLQTWRPAILIKRDSSTGVFLWFLRNFYEQLDRAPPDDCSTFEFWKVFQNTFFYGTHPGDCLIHVPVSGF